MYPYIGVRKKTVLESVRNAITSKQKAMSDIDRFVEMVCFSDNLQLNDIHSLYNVAATVNSDQLQNAKEWIDPVVNNAINVDDDRIQLQQYRAIL